MRIRGAACPKGHPWAPETTYIRPSDGAWMCRICQRESALRYSSLNREMVNARQRRRYARSPRPRDRARENELARQRYDSEAGRAKTADWRRRNPEKVRAQKAAADPELARHYQHLRRAHGEDSADTLQYMKIIAADPCSYCGGRAMHDEHIVPLARGGIHHWTNLTRACEACNYQKHARPLLQFLLGR